VSTRKYRIVPPDTPKTLGAIYSLTFSVETLSLNNLRNNQSAPMLTRVYTDEYFYSKMFVVAKIPTEQQDATR
jgi:hypothetical protein